MKGLVFFMLGLGAIGGGMYAANVGGVQQTVGANKPKVGPTPVTFKADSKINTVKWRFAVEPTADKLPAGGLPKLPVNLEPGESQTVDIAPFLKLQKDHCSVEVTIGVMLFGEEAKKAGKPYLESNVTHNICTEEKVVTLGFPQAKK